MKEMSERRESYGYLIDWIIRFGDLILINSFFFMLYFLFCKEFIPEISLSYEKKIEAILLINLSYFVASTFVRFNISSNIISIDKIIQSSSYFIALYIVIVTGSFSLFDILSIPILPWLISFLILGMLFCISHILFRLILKAYRRKGYNYRRVIIIGGGLNGIAIYNELVGSDFGYRILGFFDDNIANIDALPNYLGDTSKIQEFAKKEKIEQIYCTLPGNQDAKILELISFCEKNMIRFFLVPEFYKYIKRRFALHSLETIPILSLRYEPLQHKSNQFIKRTFDLVFSILILVLVFPWIYLIFGSIIKISSPGPIFFKQKRTGIKGKEFYCYKFRSMRLNAAANSISATKEDPRITKVGLFMRKTSIDELPQFFNVLMGDMSVVGPRPHMLKHTALYSMLIEKFMVRHLVKPGITGWAQVTGFRGETKTLADMEGRVKKDVWYIENWSFFLDLKIIFKTVMNVFKGEEKAY
ncbi:undecaprenyl-phosphate glucose phosphotransferase [Dysgonomonas sp. ZJ279]|uniref:undecaprenyl-phosphate glucose phosphotransferase n=1 Tax=Dysgonomonas sp. ZJ279 TaxID=2709796 RepID=UPI00162473BB|nr:undecaprenyl-phosphate glucose phosphotransferase [Dysgonomonas sp. ZJ279]